MLIGLKAIQVMGEKCSEHLGLVSNFNFNSFWDIRYTKVRFFHECQKCQKCRLFEWSLWLLCSVYRFGNSMSRYLEYCAISRIFKNCSSHSVFDTYLIKKRHGQLCRVKSVEMTLQKHNICKMSNPCKQSNTWNIYIYILKTFIYT